MQDAKRKDKMNVGIDIEDMLKEAYLHPAIRFASVDSDSEYPDTIRDGSTPRGARSRRSRAHSNDHVVGMPSGESSGVNSEESSIHVNREGSDGSQGTSNLVHTEGDSSTKFPEPGDSLSRRNHQYEDSNLKTWPSAENRTHITFKSLPKILEAARGGKSGI